MPAKKKSASSEQKSVLKSKRSSGGRSSDKLFLDPLEPSKATLSAQPGESLAWLDDEVSNAHQAVLKQLLSGLALAEKTLKRAVLAEKKERARLKAIQVKERSAEKALKSAEANEQKAQLALDGLSVNKVHASSAVAYKAGKSKLTLALKSKSIAARSLAKNKEQVSQGYQRLLSSAAATLLAKSELKVAKFRIKAQKQLLKSHLDGIKQLIRDEKQAVKELKICLKDLKASSNLAKNPDKYKKQQKSGHTAPEKTKSKIKKTTVGGGAASTLSKLVLKVKAETAEESKSTKASSSGLLPRKVKQAEKKPKKASLTIISSSDHKESEEATVKSKPTNSSSSASDGGSRIDSVRQSAVDSVKAAKRSGRIAATQPSGDSGFTGLSDISSAEAFSLVSINIEKAANKESENQEFTGFKSSSSEGDSPEAEAGLSEAVHSVSGSNGPSVDSEGNAQPPRTLFDPTRDL